MIERPGKRSINLDMCLKLKKESCSVLSEESRLILKGQSRNTPRHFFHRWIVHLLCFFGVILQQNCQREFDVLGLYPEPVQIKPHKNQSSLYYLSFSHRMLPMTKTDFNKPIRVRIITPDNTCYIYHWQALGGRLEAVSDEAEFYPDPQIKWFDIQVQIYDSRDGKLAKTVQDSLLVYRQIVIFKADDFLYHEKSIISDNWQKFIHLIDAKHLKASIGIIGNSLETSDPRYGQFIRQLSEGGRFEFWNHGYTHVLNARAPDGTPYCEFQNTPYEEQLSHLQKTQELARERANLVLQGFGAPGNAFDENTARALDAIPEVQMWFYGPKHSSKFIFRRTLEVEYPTHHPNKNLFIKHYNERDDCLVLQIHPNSWNENEFREFVDIVDFLRSQQVVFLTAGEYFRMAMPVQHES